MPTPRAIITATVRWPDLLEAIAVIAEDDNVPTGEFAHADADELERIARRIRQRLDNRRITEFVTKDPATKGQ